MGFAVKTRRDRWHHNCSPNGHGLMVISNWWFNGDSMGFHLPKTGKPTIVFWHVCVDIYIYVFIYLFIYLFIYNYIYMVLISLVTVEILNSFRTFALAAARASGCQEQDGGIFLGHNQNSTSRGAQKNRERSVGSQHFTTIWDDWCLWLHRTQSNHFTGASLFHGSADWNHLDGTSERYKKRGFQSYFWGTPIYGWFILWNIL